MATVQADFQDGKRVVFTARGRSWVNVREVLDDGPIGFSSPELLLIALGNCALGNLVNHQLLEDVDVKSCRATLESEYAANPRRLGTIKIIIDLEVDAPDLAVRRATLERVADSCPVGNTLRLQPQMEVELRLKSATKV